MTDQKIELIKTTIAIFCEYGSAHFCDGTPNYSVVPRGTPPKSICKYLKKGCCPVRDYVNSVSGSGTGRRNRKGAKEEK